MTLAVSVDLNFADVPDNDRKEIKEQKQVDKQKVDVYIF
jgi:hypothetical protein